jgi:CRP-like cAMP-binding protein
MAAPEVNNSQSRASLMSRLRLSSLDMSPHADLLIRRLSHFAELSQEERAVLLAVTEKHRDIPAGFGLIAEGELLDSPRLLLAGWACRMRVFPDGRRQIFEFILPGEMYGLCQRPRAVALSTAMTLTQAVIADASPLREILAERQDEFPNLVAALYCAASLDEVHLLNQLIRVGHQSAYARVAHLVLELRQRLAAVGLAKGDTIALPLTQETLADALGLSIVHLNRTLQQLRRDGLIALKGGVLRLLAPDRLAEIADFHPPRIVQAAA